jgi:hypothetical protein
VNLPVSEEDLAYLILTSRRFKFLIQLWSKVTRKSPAAAIREIDKMMRMIEKEKPPVQSREEPGALPDDKSSATMRSGDILPPGVN